MKTRWKRKILTTERYSTRLLHDLSSFCE